MKYQKMISDSLRRIVSGEGKIVKHYGICRNVVDNSDFRSFNEEINLERMLRTFFLGYLKGFDIDPLYPVESFYGIVSDIELEPEDHYDSTFDKYSGDIGVIRMNLLKEAARIFKIKVDSKGKIGNTIRH